MVTRTPSNFVLVVCAETSTAWFAFLCMYLSFEFQFALPRRCHSPLFSFHPFANIGCAVFKFHAMRFTTNKKAHHVAIDHAYIFQI